VLFCLQFPEAPTMVGLKMCINVRFVSTVYSPVWQWRIQTRRLGGAVK